MQPPMLSASMCTESAWIANSPEDMRALFDFLLPGYLGSAETFRKKWHIPTELHGDTETADTFSKDHSAFFTPPSQNQSCWYFQLTKKDDHAALLRCTGIQTYHRIKAGVQSSSRLQCLLSTGAADVGKALCADTAP